jgi:hypothetical protein
MKGYQPSAYKVIIFVYKQNHGSRMKKSFLFIPLTLLWLIAGCNRADNLSPDKTSLMFDRASQNGKMANEGFNRCMKYVLAWLGLADPATGLIPRNINDRPSKDIWNAKDCAADNYPFMVLTCALLDRELFDGRMKEMLKTETRLTSRLGSLPDTYSFSKKGFASWKIVLPDIIFGSSEYVKDGLIPLTEWLGPSEWSERMISIIDDEWKYAPFKTPFGNIISNDPEVNGDMLQSLSRLYWMTGNRKYLDEAIRIGDYYLLGNNHPTKNFKVLKLRDHGCEIVSGLCELYATVSYTDTLKKKAYKLPLYTMLDRILEKGRNEDGLFYNAIDPVKGVPVNGGLADTWGYTLNGFYTVYLLDGVERYREPVLKTLSVLNEKYRNFPWEGPSADGYADAIEGALNLYTREPLPAAELWIDSEMKVMWSKQKPSGLIEGWHGDGNFARTTIMYCLWKTEGTHLVPWRSDLEMGAVRDDSLLYISVSAGNEWHGRLMFDKKRHSEYMHLPLDWPRINQFPEYFTPDRNKNYSITTAGKKQVTMVTGNELADGLPLNLNTGETLKIIITTLK